MGIQQAEKECSALRSNQARLMSYDGRWITEHNVFCESGSRDLEAFECCLAPTFSESWRAVPIVGVSICGYGFISNHLLDEIVALQSCPTHSRILVLVVIWR
jgi:hypothetical protein